jgi:hypothetical protein
LESGYRCSYNEIKDEEVLSYNGRKIITGEGFNWGYSGSGPQYMAEAIISHYTNNNYKEQDWKNLLRDVIDPADREKDLFISEYQVARQVSKSHNLSKFQIIEQYVNEYANHRKEILDCPLDFACLVKNYLDEKLYEPTKYIIFKYLDEYFKNDYSPSIHQKKNNTTERQEVLNAIKIMCNHFDIKSSELF